MVEASGGWPKVAEYLPREGQNVAITLVLYPKYRSNKYCRRLSNSTVVYAKELIAYKRKVNRVVRVELP